MMDVREGEGIDRDAAAREGRGRETPRRTERARPRSRGAQRGNERAMADAALKRAGAKE